MTEQRPSRRAWPPMPGPVIVTKPRRISLTVLHAAVVINMLLSALIFSYVWVLKDARDTETARIREQVREQTVSNNCSLMDALPAGGPLTPLRAKYHCGPGLPVNPK